MNWEDLKVVLAVARMGSLTGAAQLLEIDQTTAGRRLSSIEAELGAILFARSKSGFAPTPAGEAAIARAIEIETRADRLAEEVAGADPGVTGIVRLTGSFWTLRRLVRVALGDLIERHPRLELRLVAGADPTLARGEAMLGLWFETPPREAAFAIKLGEVPYAVYGPADREVSGLGWVSVWTDDAPRRASARWLERHRRPGEPLHLSANDASYVQEGIGAGLGKGLLPMCLGEEDCRLVRLSAEVPELVRSLHLHVHPDTVQMLRLQAVIEWLRQSFARAFLPAAGTPTGAVP